MSEPSSESWDASDARAATIPASQYHRPGVPAIRSISLRMKRQGSQLDRLIARTRRRLLLADGVFFGGRCLLVSTSIALLAAVADRFLALGLPLWLFAAAALSAAPIAGALAWRRRATDLAAAARLDQALRLKDLLGTALAIDEDEGAMARLVREDAQRLAGRVDARAATRIEWPLSWGAAALATAACASMLWLVEPRNVFARPARPAEIAAAQAVRQRAAEALRQRADGLRAAAESGAADSSTRTEAAREALSTLDRLAEQFSAANGNGIAPNDAGANGTGAPHDSKTHRGRLEGDAELSQAAREAIQLSERLEREALIAREAQREAAQRLASIAPMHEGDPAEEFTDSLRRGDLSSAAQWIEEMDKRLSEASTEERERLAESLRRAAEELAGAAEDPPPQEAAPPPREALDELDLPADQLQEWIENPPPLDEIRRTLQEQQRDPIDAQQLAEQIQRELLERAAEARAKRQVEDAARQIRDLADAVHPPPPGETPPQGEAPQQRPQDEPRAPGDPNRPEERSGPDERPEARPAEGRGNEGATAPQPTPQQGQPRPAENEQGQPAPREGESPAPREGESPAPEPGQKPREGASRPSGEQTGQTPGESPQARPGAKPADTPAADGGARREGGAEGEQQAQPQAGNDPGREGERVAPPAGDRTERGAAEGEPPAGESNQPPTVEERIKRVREVLDEIDRSGRAADEQQEISREMREAAEDLLEQMSPQERREIERWAAQRAQEQGEEQGTNRGSPESLLSRTRPTRALEAPTFEYETQDVDLTDRGEGAGDRVIAEMFGGESPRDGEGIDRQPMSGEPARRAAQAIERALNEEAIPPRYRALIRAWAQRLPQTVESREGPQE